MIWIPWKSYNIISKAIGYCNREESLITLVLAAAVGQNICLVLWVWLVNTSEGTYAKRNDIV